MLHDVVVVGAGHAGIEAALAASRMGADVLLVTSRRDTIGLMPCNPAVGGIGKGQLVREVDALGGAMALATDATGTSFRQLNTSKGGAVRSSRAQVDRRAYQRWMQSRVEQHVPHVVEDSVVGLKIEDRTVRAVRGRQGEYRARTVVLTPGTFLAGVIHVGLEQSPGGRGGEPPSRELADALRATGLRTGRFKTGTPPRLAADSLDLDTLTPQFGDDPPVPFSFRTRSLTGPWQTCYITHTTPDTHDIVRRALDRSPLYTGRIRATGVRYCPSLEDKVVRFPGIDTHRVFLEPEGRDAVEYYPNGISTSLPVDAQCALVRTIPGLARARITRPGYAIEHDYVDPTQLTLTLETRAIRGLFLAGQINGTTGYEEAAAQGILAGVNAVCAARGSAPFTLGRSDACLGVLVDDLVTKGTDEPYRMFTSRVEYRLVLREDNAVSRLAPRAHALGLLADQDWARACQSEQRVAAAARLLRDRRIAPGPRVDAWLRALGSSPVRVRTSPARLLLRPEVGIDDLAGFLPELAVLSQPERSRLEIETKYQGYIERQQRDVQRWAQLETRRIPGDLDYDRVHGLSAEAREKLKRVQPTTIGQASRIPGVTPAAVFVLLARLGLA